MKSRTDIFDGLVQALYCYEQVQGFVGGVLFIKTF